MRSAFFAVLLGSSALISVSVLAQTAVPADLCQEMLAFAEKKAAEPPKPPAGQAATPAGAPPLRSDGKQTGTQGGGTVGPSTSTDTSSQATAPPTAPVTTGAAPEAAASPHASGLPDGNPGPSAEFKFAEGVTLQQLRDTAKRGDRQACRDSVQKMRHAGAELPAALIALAAYEPDPAKRQ